MEDRLKEFVESELVSLLGDIDRLDDFLSFGDHTGIGFREIELTKMQIKYMRLYAGVLEERLL